MNTEQTTRFIKQTAAELGFSFAGISKARKLDEEEARLAAWLKQGMHGKMHYMEQHFEKRLDPTLLVPGAKSVISLMYNYYSEKKQTAPDAPVISKYAYGKDYHHVIKSKLKELVFRIEERTGIFNGRAFVDSAPVMERQWAQQAGLGWLGKNSLLLNKQSGSYFFLAEIICDLELDYDSPVKDHCGSCTACIDACPTEAIEQPYVVNGSKCISYLTIELKDEIIPKEFSGKMENRVFGCDICQQVCPWNRFSKPHSEPAFEPSTELLSLSKSDWEEMTEEVFQNIFRYSPVKRTKFEGLKRNVSFLRQAE